MTKMTLRCAAGHDWERPAQRGRPPKFCPEHAPKVSTPRAPRTSTDASNVSTKRDSRRQEAVEKVTAYQKWVATDAAVWGDYVQGILNREQWLAAKPPVPEIPAKKDYALAGLATSETEDDE